MAVTAYRKKEGLSFKDERQPLFQSFILAALGGFLQALSWWPSSFLWPLCFVALIPLIIAVDGQSGKRAFLIGWVYGLVLSFSALPWLADVLSGYGGLGPFVAWLIFSLLAMFLALHQAFFAYIITIRIPSAFFWALSSSAVCCGFDWIKNWIFTGFNWTPLAGPLVHSPELSQAADIFGFYGLGFFVAFINFCLAVAFFHRREGLKRESKNYLIVALTIVIVSFIYGWYKYSAWETACERADQRMIAAVQPATDQAEKWDELYLEKLLNRYDLLSKEADALKPWLILWPETAMPFIYEYEYDETMWLLRLSRESQSLILTGIAGASGVWPNQKMHNRFLLLYQGKLIAYYDKLHLVPFGEYIPTWVDSVEDLFSQGLIGAAGNYSPGSRIPLMSLALNPKESDSRQVSIGILICFESIFPYLGRDRILSGAEVLVVPTNDGWFGRSRAPEQHLWQAAMRAIETRRPVARVGNTGISAIIHPSGTINSPSQLMEEGVFEMSLPILQVEDIKTTAFIVWGHYLAPFTAFFAVFLFIIRFFRKS